MCSYWHFLLQEDLNESSDCETSQQRLTDYISFRVPDNSISNITNCIGVVRGVIHDMGNSEKGYTSLEASLLCIPDGYNCVDLSLYKVNEIFFVILDY